MNIWVSFLNQKFLSDRRISTISWWLLTVAGLFIFGCGFLSFNFPLGNCDSQWWAPAYLNRLASGTGSPTRYGPIIPVLLDFIGLTGISLGIPNFIGLTQSIVVLTILLLLIWLFFRKPAFMPLLKLLVVPAIVLSFVRHTYFAETLYSESLILCFYIGLFLLLIKKELSILDGIAGGVVAAVLLLCRTDAVFVVAVFFCRVGSNDAFPRRGRRLVASLLIFLALFTFATIRHSSRQEQPAAKYMIFSEWLVYTTPPLWRGAKLFESDLVRQVLTLTKDKPPRHYFDGVTVTNSVFRDNRVGWLSLLSFMAYQFINRPALIITERIQSIMDYVASGFASFYGDYRPWSKLYSSFKGSFWGFPLEAFNNYTLECNYVFKAETSFYRLPQVRSEKAFFLFKQLCEWGRGYSVYVWRPMLYCSLVLGLMILLKGVADRPYGWLTAAIFVHLIGRGLLLCPYHRYQIAVDVIMILWMVRTLDLCLQESRKWVSCRFTDRKSIKT